jgi:phosphoglycerol transferase MdoB-like AlkP superfamily enzyme
MPKYIKQISAFAFDWYIHIFLSLEYAFFFFLLIQSGSLIPVATAGGSQILSFITGLFSINLLMFIIQMIGWNSLVFRMVSGLLISELYGLLALYYRQSKARAEYSVLLENFSLVFTSGAVMAAQDAFSRNKKLMLLLLPISFVGGMITLYLLNKPKGERMKPKIWDTRFPPRWSLAALATLVWLGLLSSEIAMHDEISIFGQKAVHYHTRSQLIESPEPYAIVGSINAPGELLTDLQPYDELPNIIIVMIESFNADYVEAYTPEGDEITPVFNQFIDNGLYVKNFYSPTIQSSRGQFATLFSQNPSWREKVFVRYEDHQYFGLADVLSEYGYQTAFVKAYKRISFDNTGEFALKNSFDHAFSVHDLLSEEDKNSGLGWGIQDETFYRYLPQMVNRIRPENGGQAPFLLVLHTVMNHHAFDALPPELIDLYPDATSRRQHYSNSIHASDAQLIELFRQMSRLGIYENSIVVITGDHSFPTGVNGVEDNEAGFYEESFRTPLLILAPGHLSGLYLKDRRFSQIDIAPTILDIIGIREVDNNFQGQSMIRSEAGFRPVFMSQPYLGKILISLRYPLKYLYHLESNAEFYFDLEADPGETNPLQITEMEENTLELFREDIRQMMRHQALIEMDMLGID